MAESLFSAGECERQRRSSPEKQEGKKMDGRKMTLPLHPFAIHLLPFLGLAAPPDRPDWPTRQRQATARLRLGFIPQPSGAPCLRCGVRRRTKFMSPLQKFFFRILPRRWAESMEADSRSWMMRCSCGFVQSIWELGASPRTFSFMKCPRCGKRSWHKLSRDTQVTSEPPKT